MYTPLTLIIAGPYSTPRHEGTSTWMQPGASLYAVDLVRRDTPKQPQWQLVPVCSPVSKKSLRRCLLVMTAVWLFPTLLSGPSWL